jgi:hypothetical protein
MDSNKVYKALLFLELGVLILVWVWFLAVSQKYNGDLSQNPQVLKASPMLLLVGGAVAVVSFVISLSSPVVRSKGYTIMISLILTVGYGVSYFLLYTLLTKYVK